MAQTAVSLRDLGSYGLGYRLAGRVVLKPYGPGCRLAESSGSNWSQLSSREECWDQMTQAYMVPAASKLLHLL